ncbi:uncharacterized protein topaz1 isoform X2 [Plectropomus leopardus]|nr:uncharacterized protein topaz1 isoform X2 [Plectropomus leopardus]
MLLCPPGLAGSEGSLRRAVRTSGCGLCGDCKYISPQRKILGEQGRKNSSSGPEQPLENAVTESSKKIVIWIDQYPKVTLCDVAQKCDSFSHDCGYVLPDVLKTKVVHCFKQDMRAGAGPGCLGREQHEREEHVLAADTECQSEEGICQSQSVTEQQRHLSERTDVQTLSTHTKCHFLNGRTSVGSAVCSASISPGKCMKKVDCRTGMWDRNVEDRPGPLTGADIHRDKRIKLADSVKDGVLPCTPDLETISCKDSAKSDSRDHEMTYLWMSDDSHSCSEHPVEGSSSFGSTMKENCVHKEPSCETDNPAETDAAQMSSEPSCQGTEVDTDRPESFTCQRVRVYLRKIRFSCARTYMSWPFFYSGWTLKAHAATTGCPVEPRDKGDSQVHENQKYSSSNQTSDMLPNASIDTSSGTAHPIPYQNKEKQDGDGESILAERNWKRRACSCSVKIAPSFLEAEESSGSLCSDTATLSNPSQRGTDTYSPSSTPAHGPETGSFTSTPSSSALGLGDWEPATTLSASSSPKRVVKAAEKTLFHCEENQKTSWTSFSNPPHNSDSLDSCQSSLLLPQESDEGWLTGRSPPKLEPYYKTSPFSHDLTTLKKRFLQNVFSEKGLEIDPDEVILPPVLSPLTSPRRPSQMSPLSQTSGCLDEEEGDEINYNTSKFKISPGCHMAQIFNASYVNSMDPLECDRGKFEGVQTNFQTTSGEPQSSRSPDEYVDDDNEEESEDETDCEDVVEQGSKNSALAPSNPKITSFTCGARSKPSSDEDDNEAFSDEEEPCSADEDGSSPFETACNETDGLGAEAAGDPQHSTLNEFTAFKQDILLVDVIQDDPELFENMPQESLLKLGPTRVTEAPKSRSIGVVRIDGASPELKQSFTPVKIHFRCDSPDMTEQSDSRPWRPQSSIASPKTQSSTGPASEKQTKNMRHPDNNNNHVNGVLESRPIPTVNSLHGHISPLMSVRKGSLLKTPANMTEFRHQKSNAYCRQYFSESLSCGFKMCRFQHVPVKGDEKLCIETVTRFSKNPLCLQKAGAVYTGYYQNNPPGVYFSVSIFLSLLWALLKAGMVSDVFSVLSVSLAHKIVPGHEFLLALFNTVREKGLTGFVPELMQLTFKMASVGLVLSLDCLDCVRNTPEFQQTLHPNSAASVSANHMFSTSAPFPEYLNLAHSIVEIELCTKQEDWRRMGQVFRSICQSSKHSNHVGRISGHIAIALLSESKDKLSLPFAAFAETVCLTEGEDSLMKTFLGRIGVSLMLRYHKTHQWAKGRRVVEVLSVSKVYYSTLKGLFGNEDGASRCYLVTVATELFLLSGSVEGALNTLRENKWFLSSCSWPCEPADLESRTRVLIRLAEKTSHRDTLEVLSNLPGLKEPNDLVDISGYVPLFNSHLQVCEDRQILPVASDTVDFMLSKNLAVDQTLLRTLLQKLGKQNLWLRAREVFRHSLSEGYYPGVSAPPGFMTLIVPCQLGEVELALSYEMFITVNATDIIQLPETSTSCLSITLKRTQSCESEYLSAGSRILSAACIPQPKLTVHYTAVNAAHDQVFTVDISSARCWLRHNHLWANEVWMH